MAHPKHAAFKPGNKLAEKWTKQKAELLIDALEKWYSNEDHIYLIGFWCEGCRTIPEFANGLNKDTGLYLCEKYDWFAARYRILESNQEYRLVNKATNNKTNAKFTEFILNCKFGYNTKTEVINTNKNINVLNIDPLDKE